MKFIRFGADIDSLRSDIERGYSFAGYMAFNSKGEALDNATEMGIEAPLAQHANGQWGYKLDGLCGYEFDGERRPEDFPYAQNASAWVVAEGRYVGEADGGDGDLFIPSSSIIESGVC